MYEYPGRGLQGNRRMEMAFASVDLYDRPRVCIRLDRFSGAVINRALRKFSGHLAALAFHQDEQRAHQPEVSEINPT